MHHFKPKRKRGNPDNYCTYLVFLTYVHSYICYIHSCIFTYVRKYISYHTQFVYYIGKGTDETCSDIGSSLESRETEYLDKNGDHKLSQSMKHQKMSEEATEAKDTTCKVDYYRINNYVIVMIRRIVTIYVHAVCTYALHAYLC